MVGLEIGSPKLDLMKLISYTRPGVCILSAHIAKFHTDCTMFETFEMQQFKADGIQQNKGVRPAQHLTLL
jgi:hypothetical protein